MGYIAFRVGKIKTTAGLTVTRSHNQREAFCDNADQSRQFMNRQIMPCADNYADFVQERIDKSPYFAATGKQPRNDAVRALELIFRVSAEEMDTNPFFDLDRFCDITKKWVCDKFGAENVADLVLHMDEGYGEQNGSLKCAPHIHAVVVPITKEGKLSATEFIGGPQKMREMQTEVAAQYKELRLKRGMKESVATPHEMRKFYAAVHAAQTVNLPSPGEHETAQQYSKRIIPEVQKMQSQHLAEVLKTQRERGEARTRVKQLQGGKDVIAEELEQRREELDAQERRLQMREQAIKKDANVLQQWNDVCRGLKASSITQSERDAFLHVAAKALQVGKAEREQDEIEAQDNAQSRITPSVERK